MNTEKTYSNHVASKAKWILWCIETDSGFTMMGSRKVNQIDIEVDYGWNNLDLDNLFGSISASGCIPTPRVYKMTGNMAGFTMVVAKTELEALITLMHTFQQEEAAEKAEAEMVSKRFKDEKKRKKAHEKAVRQAAEGKFDATKCPENCWYCQADDGWDCCEDCG